MWLLETSTLQLQEFTAAEVPPYAILSHTWAEEEVSFHEFQELNEKIVRKRGFAKVHRFCQVAREHGYRYSWVDTVAIDKRSSAELSEAINSMYQWYSHADLCIIYLGDLSSSEDYDGPEARRNALEKSRWFGRGWTMQELVACRNRKFFANDWSEITSQDLGEDIIDICAKVTGICATALRHERKLEKFCIAERMSWASRRVTMRPEDRAYSLIGVFGVSLSVIYGEGLERAFRRLQDEIMKTSFDQTLFAWRSHRKSSGLLAKTPADFADTPPLGRWHPAVIMPFSMTNVGMSIRPRLFTRGPTLQDDTIQVVIQCDVKTEEGWMLLLIRLKRITDCRSYLNGKYHTAWRRVNCDTWDLGPRGELGDPQDLLILEDEHSSLVSTSLEEDENRREEKAWGRTLQSMSIAAD